MLHRLPDVRHKAVDARNVRVTYREALPDRNEAPTILLLHGFPSGAHQFQRLIDTLGHEYRVIAPDFPGFGLTGVDFPDHSQPNWTFEWLTDVLEQFLIALDAKDLVLYVFDWGGPIGLRLAGRRPAWIRGLIVQNANIYEDGLSDAARNFIELAPGDEGAMDAVQAILTENSTMSQHLTGVRDVELVAPENWLLDQAYLDRGDRLQAQLNLAFDYKSNVAMYPRWQQWLRAHQPPTLVVWGKGDPFFTAAGATAYLRDVPAADVHLLDTGHFALDERLGTVATLVADFMYRNFAG